MVQQDVDIALRLVQLIALALPAVAILLQVLIELNKEPYNADEGDWVSVIGSNNELPPGNNVVLKTRAGETRNYWFAQLSIPTFVVSAILLLVFLAIHLGLLGVSPQLPLVLGYTLSQMLLGLALLFIALSLLLILLSILSTEPMKWKEWPAGIWEWIRDQRE